MKRIRIQFFGTLGVALALSGCATQKLNTAAKVALVTEKSAAGGLHAIDEFAQDEKARCEAEELQTQAERAACVELAIKAVSAAEVVGEQLQATLENFWDVWAVLKAKSDSGIKPTPEDWARLAAVAARVQEQFETLKPHLKNISKKD